MGNYSGRGAHNRKLSDEQRQELFRRYQTQLPDGTWVGVPTLAREYGVRPNAIYSLFERNGIETRGMAEAQRGKGVKDRGSAPACKCGCGSPCYWRQSRNRWSEYATGHYRTDAPYKDAEWLRDQYVGQKKTVSEIGMACGVSKSSVTRYLDRFGIPRRSASVAHIGRQGGSNNPAWKGGVTPERQRLYKSQAWKQIIGECFSRDDFRCVRCDAPKRKRGDLHAHHLRPWADAPELRMDLGNLVTLCKPCHLWVHSRDNVDADFLL